MSNGTVVMGLFDRSADADAAIAELTASGVDATELSVVLADQRADAKFSLEEGSHVGEGAAIGAGIGGGIGALVAGFAAAGAIATGGAGVIVAGPLVAALAGAGAGAATGGAVGGLIGLGIPEHEIKFYEDSVARGSVLLGARVPREDASRTKALFERHRATKVTSHGCELAGPAVVARSDRRSVSNGVSASEWGNASPLRELFVDQLCDIYYAEHKLADGLEELASAAGSPELAGAFRSHRLETRGHIERLENVFDMIGVKPEQKKCPAINGILAEAKGLMKLDHTMPMRDAALICAAQKAEHYEIGTYGCLRAYAQTLGLDEPARVLGETLQEEWGADRRLTTIAQAGINREATLVGSR